MKWMECVLRFVRRVWLRQDVPQGHALGSVHVVTVTLQGSDGIRLCAARRRNGSCPCRHWSLLPEARI